MFNVNRVTLLGNATRDPEVHATKAGREISVIGLATSRVWKDAKGERKSEPEYHRLVCFGALGALAQKRVRKGAPLYAEGRLHTSRWENPQGETMSRTEVVVDRLVLLSATKGGKVDAAEAPVEEVAA
ncbi:MAG: single-stranded DNA-binding protein [Patescibacteria group bacterium]